MTIFNEGNIASDKFEAWIKYTNKIKDWQTIAKSINPKETGCGLIYEIEDPHEVNSPDEDFAIADMRLLSKSPGYSEPHYHPGMSEEYPKGVIEIYIVLCGSAKSIVGASVFSVSTGDVIVIPPMTSHYVIPDSEFVIAVISSPPFKPESYIPLVKTNVAVKFDAQQFEKLTSVK